eukprot:gb/GFBE01075142.1/.p3 GENE.gb/GFBE01075142.1/~~gb/GFBE01075142.1/.p3  ORF type:complete len:107 (-),score=23.62 gb/GFBE01075142.1/:90-410(-)
MAAKQQQLPMLLGRVSPKPTGGCNSCFRDMPDLSPMLLGRVNSKSPSETAGSVAEVATVRDATRGTTESGVESPEPSEAQQLAAAAREFVLARQRRVASRRAAFQV